MTNACTQNTDRACREEDCCLNNMEIPYFSKFPHVDKFFNDKSHYILDENKNVIPATLMEWGCFLEKHRLDRIVSREEINGLRVSTVFIGLDHSWLPRDHKDHKPDIFETMVFKNESDIYCERYSTWQEAEYGHKKAVEWVLNGCKEDE